MPGRVCRLCSGSIAADALQQHVTGDYHKICMSAIVAADLGIEIVKRASVCSLCGEVIAANSVVARPARLTIHLGCFFGRDGRRSVGAAAATPTLKDHSVALRQAARALRRFVGRVLDGANATRARPADACSQPIRSTPMTIDPSQRDVMSDYEGRLLEGHHSLVCGRLAVRRARVLRIAAADARERARRASAAAAGFERALRLIVR